MQTNQAQPKLKIPKKKRQIHSNLIPFVSKRDSSYYTDKDKVVSITYEEIGLFPRSFSRVLDRFLKQLFSDVDNLVIQEYRFYRYLFLTTIKTIFILFFLPFLVNFAAKNYIVKPITEYFWNTSHPEIFLNSYEQKRAFVEFEKFEEKIYFETLVQSDIHSLDYLGNVANFGGWRSQDPFLKTSLAKQVNFSKKNSFKESLPDDVYLAGFLKESDSGFIKYNKVLPLTTLLIEPARLKPNMIMMNTPKMLWLTHTTCSALQPSPQGLSKSQKTNHDYDIEEDWPRPQQAHVLRTLYENPVLFNKPFSINDFNSTSLILSEKQKTYPFDDNLNKPQNTLITVPIIKKNQNLSNIYQENLIELATYYNNHSIEAITNFFADLLSLCTLLYLLITLSIQINITKSFLLEVFFGLDDSKKSLFILLITDLLVGYHSSNLWELFFEFIFNHYGIPESQTGIFLLVATLPVLLDVLFKYLIFRHLNRSSPATVATYQAMIE